MLRDDAAYDDDDAEHRIDACGALAVMRAYVDASDRNGLLSVAVHLIHADRVRRFKRAWRGVFGDRLFSWADLVNRGTVFKMLQGKENDAEHRRLVSSGVNVVREHVLAASVVSCWKQDVERFGPTWIAGFGNAYSIAGHMAIAGMGMLAKRRGHRGGISYLLETGDDGQNELLQLLAFASKSSEGRDLYQWLDHRTAPKAPSSPFHAPDLLAWEWGKWWTDSVFEKKRPMRMSFVRSFASRPPR